MKHMLYLGWTIVVVFPGCAERKTFKARLERTLKENPEILLRVIEEHPDKFVRAYQRAIEAQRRRLDLRGQRDSAQGLEKAFAKRFNATVRPDESFQGPKEAPLLLVVYFDFQCTYCARGQKTVKSLSRLCQGKLKVVYKHLPLGFHPQAMRAAQYYEAIRLQSAEKAFRFHDLLFAEQARLSQGDCFLLEVSKQAGADMEQLTKAVDSSKVKERITQDLEEARRFGIRGTPTYLLNGIRIVGARPQSFFVKVINRLIHEGEGKAANRPNTPVRPKKLRGRRTDAGN